MSSPKITWQSRGTVTKSAARTSRPTLSVHDQKLWLIYLGDETSAGSGLYFVYYQTAKIDDPKLAFTAPQAIRNGSTKLVMTAGSQIGLRIVRFGGLPNPETLVLWVTWTQNSKSSVSIFLLNDETGIWTQYNPPSSLTDKPILDGGLGVINPGTPAEGLIYFALTPPDSAGTGNVVRYVYFDGLMRIWSNPHTFVTRYINTGYNILCISDWSLQTQMILGYYKDSASRPLDLYAHDGNKDTFTYLGPFTTTGVDTHDAARGGMQSAQNPQSAPTPNLTYVAFEGIDPGAVGKVWVCVHTGKWYYGASVLDNYTTTAPGIAADGSAVYCVWTAGDNSGAIQFASGTVKV